MAAMPEADIAKRQAGGRHFAQLTMPRPSQRQVDVSAHKEKEKILLFQNLFVRNKNWRTGYYNWTSVV